MERFAFAPEAQSPISEPVMGILPFAMEVDPAGNVLVQDFEEAASKDR